MKNLIFCAYAFSDGYQTSLQLNKASDNSTYEMYMKNIFVALSSARLNNPEDDICVVTNIPLEAKWATFFANEGISNMVVPFNDFVMPKQFPWALAFFKLCALKSIIASGSYDNILLMDADTYTTMNYSDLWMECTKGVLLFPVGHSYTHRDRETIRTDFSKLYRQEAVTTPITHFGGEFVAGNITFLKIFIKKCEEIFEKIKSTNYDVEPNIGDETIWSIAASLCILLGQTCPIITASPYIFRFWTSDFYLISSVTHSNPVCIWHLPQEKGTGILKLYDYYCKHNSFPNNDKACAMLGILMTKRPLNRYTLSYKIKGKINSLWKKVK